MDLIADSKCDIQDNPECLPEITINEYKSAGFIKHLVISGGGILGFSYYGILKESNNQKLWMYKDIQTIYGTSIGSILATIMCLQYDWQTLDEYLINRPWQKVFHYDLNAIFNCVHNNGIYSRTLTEKIFSPLLLGKDIPVNVNMFDFYQKTKMELHIMITNVNHLKPVDISYKTHPNWLLIDAIHASCSIPILFQPIYIDNILYCDGGFCTNYPIDECIQNGANPNEILGINTEWVNNEDIDITMFSLFDYVVYLLNKILQKLLYVVIKKNKYTFILPSDTRSLSTISNVADNRETRQQLIQQGIDVFYQQYNPDN
jgi:predicted acylesterase/phospholipase RssA